MVLVDQPRQAPPAHAKPMLEQPPPRWASHHADPTYARHGVLRGQVDPTARIIWFFEKAGWVNDVRWPAPQRLQARQQV